MLQNSLFSGMNVHNMNVNFNFKGMPDLPLPMNQQITNQQPINNALLPQVSQNPILLEDKTQTDYDHVLFAFENTYIDKGYTFHYIEPVNSFDDSLYDQQFIITDKEELYLPNTVAEIFYRYNENPPILTILDYKDVEGIMLDQIFHRTVLLTKKYNFDSFFLVLETSGAMLPGEPFHTKFDKSKGLFKKEIYSIKI